jgi:hypothetical protein
MKVSLTIKDGVMLLNQPNTLNSGSWLAAELDPGETVILQFKSKKIVVTAEGDDLKIEEKGQS